VKPYPPHLTFEQALQRGFVGRIESRKYMDWVKTLPCVGCNSPADDPHHPYGVGFKGMGSKVPDYWVIPLCRNCHDNLHHDPLKWEDVNGEQIRHALMTLTQALYEGRLKL
jgi:hypothetical protein